MTFKQTHKAFGSLPTKSISSYWIRPDAYQSVPIVVNLQLYTVSTGNSIAMTQGKVTTTIV